MRLSEGYDTQLGGEGIRLSGGQKQRVALARALLTDADILILDETTRRDSKLEQEVQRGIWAMYREYIMIAIPDRLSTVQNADYLYTVESGANERMQSVGFPIDDIDGRHPFEVVGVARQHREFLSSRGGSDVTVMEIIERLTVAAEGTHDTRGGNSDWS